MSSEFLEKGSEEMIGLKKYIPEVILIFIFVFINVGILFVMQNKISKVEINNVKVKKNSTVSGKEESLEEEEPVIELSKDCIINDSFGNYCEKYGKFDKRFIENYILSRDLKDLDPQGQLNFYKEEFKTNYYGENAGYDRAYDYIFDSKSEALYEDFLKLRIAIMTLGTKHRAGYGAVIGKTKKTAAFWNDFFGQFEWFEVIKVEKEVEGKKKLVDRSIMTREAEFKEEFSNEEQQWILALYNAVAGYEKNDLKKKY